MISIVGLRKAFGARQLFRGADLRIGARDRLALVGPNGSGKTTLFEIIAGIQEPDGGSISLTRGTRLGYLAQTTDALRGRSIIAEVLSATPAMAEVGHRLEILTRELTDITDPSERDSLIHEYSRLQARFETLGGYSAEARAREICAGLGYDDATLEHPTESLSGGWLMRVALAKLLVSSPDALLLDEPTNHLDLESVRWLEGFLKTFEGAVLLISHDRDFMNGFANRVVEIDRELLATYTGNYESFVSQREMRARQAAAAAANQKRRTDQLEIFINRFRYKNTKASQVQSKIKLLERMGTVDAPPETRRRAMNVRFPTAPRAGRVIVELKDVSFSYGDKAVYSGLDFAIERGQKVALVGANGAGKSTLLKLLAGALAPSGGERRLGQNVDLGYFAQHQIESLDDSNRVIEELETAVPAGVPVRSRDLLGRFLFSGDEANKRVAVLSGGERSRLAMAKILVSARNFLCLDEPTNHLDIWSRDVLEDALTEYDGALVLITHDRHLIRSVADTIAEVRNGRVRLFVGSYDDYLTVVEQEEAPPARVSSEPTPAKQRRRATAEERASVSRRRTAMRRVEEQLDAIHAEIREMEERMANPSFYATEEDIAGFMRAYNDKKNRVPRLEAEWDALT